MSADTSEKGLEILVCQALCGNSCDPNNAQEPQGAPGGMGWRAGYDAHYNKEYCLDTGQLLAFLRDTQPQIAKALYDDTPEPEKRGFLRRLDGELAKRGIVDVLRNGINHNAHNGIKLYCALPSAANKEAKAAFAKNRFTVARQLHYSANNNNSLDIVLFVNGLPVATLELKNNLTRQTAENAVYQYQTTRSSREKLFARGRCAVHFAVDDNEAYFCAELRDKASVFLPFNKGHKDGAGNPPNPNGIKTDYLWRNILAPRSLADILENFAQKTETGNIWPRYHQLDAVQKLLATASVSPAGQRRLVQHSAGSGKSNTIAWLACQLVELTKETKEAAAPLYESVVVVTDRKVLDRQICDTIKRFAQMQSIVGHAENARNLRELLQNGKRLVISTVQKFPFIAKEIHGGNKRYAVIIDEAHSGQGGRAGAALARALGGTESQTQGEEDFEDALNRVMEERKLPPNADFFAFTATPKAKTLNLFGEARPQPNGENKREPFHLYTMKQAIEERFIVDVLAHYMPVATYCELVKTAEQNPKFDSKKAQKKLRRYAEKHDRAIETKAEVIVEHFFQQAVYKRKVGGQARAMVVTASVERAIMLWRAINRVLQDQNSPYKALVAFAGVRELDGETVSEEALNGFPSDRIPEEFRANKNFRFLVCAEKFQTGYDEPLLYAMYVDKRLDGVMAVQTLSRLNRAHPLKTKALVLDFVNFTEDICKAFAPYYLAAILSRDADPNKLHDLKSAMDGTEIYAPEQVDDFARLFLADAPRDELDPILDECVEKYRDLSVDGQIKFKRDAVVFVRSYEFLASVLPYTNAEWEKLSIFLHLLVRKLPSPQEEDLPHGILNMVDMDSYRAQKHAEQKIEIPEKTPEINPPEADAPGGPSEPDMRFLDDIVAQFNERWGDMQWENPERVRQLIGKEIPEMILNDEDYQNALKNSDEQNARIQLGDALQGVMAKVFREDTQLYKLYSEGGDFKEWLTDKMFKLSYQKKPPSGGAPA